MGFKNEREMTLKKRKTKCCLQLSQAQQLVQQLVQVSAASINIADVYLECQGNWSLMYNFNISALFVASSNMC